MTTTVLHLTTLHARDDTRIFIKEVQTAARDATLRIHLMVADGLGNEIRSPGIIIHDLGRPGGSRPVRVAAGLWRALAAVRRVRPDVVHFHDPELLPIGFACKALGMRVVYDAHEDAPRLALSKAWLPAVFRVPTAAGLAILEWLGARTFDAIVSATPAIARRFPGPRTVTVQNFPIPSELMVAEPIPYSTRPARFAYVGGISQARSAFETVRAFALLADPDARLELAGDIQSPGLEARLRAEEGWRYVRYHGSVDRLQVARLLSNVRAGLVLFHPLPNHVAAQPNKMFEYMSASLPVIGSDFPLWREIIEGSGCGLLVDPQDPNAIAAALRLILDHPAEAEAMGRRGREAVERIYNWEAEAGKLLGTYRRLAQ